MNNPLKQGLILLGMALLLAGAFPLFSSKQAEVQPHKPKSVEAQIAPSLTAIDPEEENLAQIIKSQLRNSQSLTNLAISTTRDVSPELAELQEDLITLNEVLAANATNLYASILEVKRLASQSIAAQAELGPIKDHLSKLLQDLSAIDTPLKANHSIERSEGLRAHRHLLKNQMTETRDLLKEKERALEELKNASDKAHIVKIRLHREGLEHTNWKQTLQSQISDLTPEESK